MPFPEGKLVYDYVFEPAKMKWGAWLDRLDPKAVANSDAEYTSIIVPTGECPHAVVDPISPTGIAELGAITTKQLVQCGAMTGKYVMHMHPCCRK